MKWVTSYQYMCVNLYRMTCQLWQQSLHQLMNKMKNNKYKLMTKFGQATLTHT